MYGMNILVTVLLKNISFILKMYLYIYSKRHILYEELESVLQKR